MVSFLLIKMITGFSERILPVEMRRLDLKGRKNRN